MQKLRAILGYVWAALLIPLALATLFEMNSWMNLLVSGTGLTISPWFSGDVVVRTVEHGGYEMRIHRPVFQALIGERREGFVQMDWGPLDALPAQVDEEVDFDGDGQADFRVVLDTASGQATLTPLTEYALGLAGTFRLDEAWAVRAALRNPRR
jgi:hypothetical protein